MYILCNENNQYLHQEPKSKYQIVQDINKAHVWNSINKAQNVLNNNCQTDKQLNKFTWHIVNIVNKNEPVAVSMDGVKPAELNYSILEKVKEIHTFIKELEQRKLYLVDKLHEIEMEIVDIEHAAEFYNLNASQGYKLYKMLHNARIKRREIKDELQIIGYTLASSLSSKSMDHLQASIAGLDTRKYTPRVNKELFGV